jgi:predicted Zn-dependent peptidase
MMRATQRGLAAGLTILLLGFAALAQTGDITRGIRNFTLPNGLQLVVAVRPELQLSAVNLTVNIGSIDDPPGQSGMAHLLEHVTLSGSTSVGTLDAEKEANALEELDRAYQSLDRERRRQEPEPAILVGLERWFEQAQEATKRACETGEILGGRLEAHGAIGLNATTTADATQFFTSIPNEEVELWLSLEAERLQHPILRRFYSERNVVLREVAGLTGGRPTMQERFLREIFPGAPAAQALAGDPEQIKSIDRPTAFAYFRRFYRPENITIAVVGNVDPEKVYQLALHYFAKWQPPGTAEWPRSRREQPPLPASPAMRTFNSTAGPAIFFAFPEPAASPAHNAAVEAVAELINSADLSPLRRRLVQEQSVAWSVAARANYPSQKQPAIFLVHVYGTSGTEPQQLAQDAAALLKSLGKSSDEDIAGAALGAEMHIAAGLDDPPTLASLLALHQAINGDWRTPFVLLQALRTLTGNDVRAAANDLAGSVPSASVSTGAK